VSKEKRRPNLTSLTLLLKGSDLPTEVGLFTGAQEQFWPDALPAPTGDSAGIEPRLAWRNSIILTTEPTACFFWVVLENGH